MTDGLEGCQALFDTPWGEMHCVLMAHGDDWPHISKRGMDEWAKGLRASESALRAVAQELVYGENFGQHVGDCKIDHVRDAECTCYLAPLKAALDGAPWEPSEEQVERAAEAGWRAIDTDDDWALIEEKNRAPWRIFARAALKAALGLESGSAG